jgi:flagellar hook assembly protein FlgD
LITITDLNGKLVETLQNGTTSAGFYNYELNANNLGTGLYIAKVIINNQVNTIKLMVK